MKRLFLFFLSLLIGVGLLVWIIRIIGWQEIKSAFLIFTGWQGLIILILSALMLWTGLWKWQVILRGQGYNFPQRRLANPYLACFSLIYLFPMVVFGGEIFRAYVLKEKYAVPWAKAVASAMVDKILEGTSFLITSLAGLSFFLLAIGLPPRNLGLIIGGTLLFLTSGLAFFYFKSFKKESIAKLLAKFLNLRGFLNEDILEIEREIFRFFKLRKKAFWQALALAFLRVAITWFRCWLLILFLAKSIGALPALSILGFYYLALFIPIPMALGSHEAIQFFSFNALGLGANLAPVFTMIQRGAELILAFLGLIIFFRLGLGFLRIFLFKKIDSFIKTNDN